MGEFISPLQKTTRKGFPLLNRLSRNLLFSLLAEIERGLIIIEEGGTYYSFGKVVESCPVTARLEVKSPDFYSMITLGGDIGAGEAYILGYWDSEDPADLVRVITSNPQILDRLNRVPHRAGSMVQRLFHCLKSNTVKESIRNIHAHYDVGNDFFSLFLDPTMAYSSAIFEKPGMTLEEAQVAKFDRICTRLGLHEGHHLMEIGTGWGGLAIHAARVYGCRVDTTTISSWQYEYALSLVKKQGLEDRVRVLNLDYRHLEGCYDRLVSIEMIEAIGYRNLDSFFGTCCRLLKPGGELALQAITMLDSRFEQHKDHMDFIKKYIFPGSCILSVASMLASSARATDLRLTWLEDIGPDYARTLKIWRDNLLNRREEVARLGYSPAFIRMWDFYFSYCEGAFDTSYISNAQMVFSRPPAG